MSRSFTYSAITLRVKPSGESNRETWFLTAEEGVLKATLFGGPKSRLRSYVAPFHGGTLWIYHDPVRDSRKVVDFDVKSWRPGIRELWERAMTANAIAETVLSSQAGGGNWKTAVKFSEKVLDALNGADPASCARIWVYFLWHWARILGIRPEFPVCSHCACEPKDGWVLWYSVREEAFCCEKCAGASDLGGRNAVLRLESGVINWLKALETLSPAALWPVDSPALEQAKALSQAIMAAALGKRLPTWELM